MNLVAINENVNRLLANVWSILSFFKEYLIDSAKDVSITFQNADGTETTNTFPNIAKQIESGGVFPLSTIWAMGKNGVVIGTDGKIYYPNKSGNPADNDPVLKTDNTDWYGAFDTLSEAFAFGDTNSGIVKPITVTVTGATQGDFDTINEAIEHLDLTYGGSRFIANNDTHITATINLLAGYLMQEQVFIYGRDLGWITIVGEDAETNADTNFLTRVFLNDESTDDYPFFGGGENSVLPTIGQLFNAINEASHLDLEVVSIQGVHLHNNSCITVAEGAGIKGVTLGYGILLNRSSVLQGEGSIFQNNNINAYVGLNSQAQLTNAQLQNAGNCGIFAVSSDVTADYSDVSSAGRKGCHIIHGSAFSGLYIIATGCGGHPDETQGSGMRISASTADIMFGDFSGSLGYAGLDITECANVMAESADVSNSAGIGIVCDEVAICNIHHSAMADCVGYSVRVDLGGMISITGSNIETTNVSVNTLSANGIIYK